MRIEGNLYVTSVGSEEWGNLQTTLLPSKSERVNCKV